MNEPVFQLGDVIEWCDSDYEVLANHGDRGRVRELPNGPIIDPFHWTFGGPPRARLIRRASPAPQATPPGPSS